MSCVRLQVWGAKQWRVYGSPQYLPYTHEQLGKGDRSVPSSVLQEPVLADTLHSGDVLYIPRGHVHQAHTTDAPSLHLTLAVATHDWTWGTFIADAFNAVRGARDPLRQSIPLNILQLLHGQVPSAPSRSTPFGSRGAPQK